MESRLTSLKKAALGFISGMTLCAFVIFASGCELGDLGFDFNMPIGPVGPDPYVPGTVTADSIVSFAEGDSVYGHFAPLILNQNIRVLEFGFDLYKNGTPSLISLVQNEDWQFSKSDSIVSCRAWIPRITDNISVSITVILTARDPLGNSTTIHSSHIVIREFEPAFMGVQDSVSFPEKGKAIMWGHFQTTIDCEILEAQINSYFGYSSNSSTPITLPQQLKATEMIHIRDTIDVSPGMEYFWTIQAKAKFANDSLGTVNLPHQKFQVPL